VGLALRRARLNSPDPDPIPKGRKMTSRTLSRTTALLTSLTLALPQGVLIGPALAQDQTILMLCLDMSLPPCPPGEPIDGTPTPVSDPEAALAADLCREADGQRALDVRPPPTLGEHNQEIRQALGLPGTASHQETTP